MAGYHTNVSCAHAHVHISYAIARARACVNVSHAFYLKNWIFLFWLCYSSYTSTITNAISLSLCSYFYLQNYFDILRFRPVTWILWLWKFFYYTYPLNIYNVFKRGTRLVKLNSSDARDEFNLARGDSLAKMYHAPKGANSRVDDRMGCIVDWVEWH